MALLWRDQFGLRPTSVRVTVPDDDVARLMYYLNCVFTVIEYKDQDVRKYRDYHNYDELSYAEQRMVWLFALTLSPDEFDNKVFFQSDELCGDRGNKFYELSQVRHQVLAVQSILVAGQTRRVRQIMAYKMSWMQKNYYEPMRRLASRLSPQAQRPVTARRPTTAYIVPASDACTIS